MLHALVKQNEKSLNEADQLLNSPKDDDGYITAFKKYQLILARTQETVFQNASNLQCQIMDCKYSLILCQLAVSSITLEKALTELIALKDCCTRLKLRNRNVIEEKILAIKTWDIEAYDYNRARFIATYIESTNPIIETDFLGLDFATLPNRIVKLKEALALLKKDLPDYNVLRAGIYEKLADLAVDMGNKNNNPDFYLQADSYYQFAIESMKKAGRNVPSLLHRSRLYVHDLLAKGKDRKTHEEFNRKYAADNDLRKVFAAIEDEVERKGALEDLKAYVVDEAIPLPIKKRRLNLTLFVEEPTPGDAPPSVAPPVDGLTQ